jgi:hypothetical protein
MHLAAAFGAAGLAGTAPFAPAAARGDGPRFSSAGAAVRHAAGLSPVGGSVRPGPGGAPGWRPAHPGGGWTRPPGHAWGHRPYSRGWRPWPHAGWYRTYRRYGYGVIPFSVGVGVGLYSSPYYWGYAPPPPVFYEPYPSAFPYPAPYPPPVGAVCVAGTLTCPLEGPATLGDACNCPTPAGRAWGRVGG